MLRRVWSVVTTILIVLMILLAIALAGVRLFGYTPYAILSGSMVPQYQAGDLVYIKETPPQEIRSGDVIAFVADESRTVVTHRVVEEDHQAHSFRTKGDANNSVDGKPVLYENVLGVARFSLPKLGYLSYYLTSPSGRYVGIAVFLGLILLMILPEVFKKNGSKHNNHIG